MRALVSVLTTRRMPLCPCSDSISRISLIEIASRSPASAWPMAANARASATAASAERDSASSTAARTPAEARVSASESVSRMPNLSEVRLPTTCETTACRASGANGLAMKSTTLDALAKRASRSSPWPRATITTTGTRPSAASLANRRQISAASRLGISPSRRMRSGTVRASRTRVRPASSSEAVETTYPASDKASSMTFRTVGLSSITSRCPPGMTSAPSCLKLPALGEPLPNSSEVIPG